MNRRVFNFPGGVALRHHKKVSTTHDVVEMPIPSKIVLPLQQHIGEPAEPVVNIGDHVYKGQIIARDNADICSPVHASTSGKIISIGQYSVPHPSGIKSPCIVIKPDGFDQSRREKDRYVEHASLSPSQIRDMIHHSGVVGMGGAGFPSALKLDPKDKKIETLIINGAECEPYITCDDMLMREQAVEILEGVIIMRHALQASYCVIAIETNKTHAFKSMSQAVNNLGINYIEVVKVPTAYPAGGEKQLIQAITGKEVPSQKLPLDINIVCHNVATAYAVCRAVEHGEPLIHRYVTIAGSVAKARNLSVLIGTPISEIIEFCGGNLQSLNRVIIGGPMMGFALHDVNAPVIKTTNCVLANSVVSDVPMPSRDQHSMPCIRCGACAEACPMQLLPQQMYWYARAKDLDKIQDYNLFDCIECGCCDYVCPSHIPLVQYYRYAKMEIWQQEQQKQLSDISRQRFEFRTFRLEREKQERAARHKQKQAALKKPSPEKDEKKAAIQAAMERARAKREKSQITPKNTENLTLEQQQLVDAADTRRAKKTAKQTTAKSSSTKNNHQSGT